jgi:hypothetical protein
MRFAKIGGLLGLSAIMVSCSKDNLPKEPLLKFKSVNWLSTIRRDTILLEFEFQDGDADLDASGKKPSIFCRDARFDSTTFTGYPFPEFDGRIKDPKKGLTGTCKFYIDGSMPGVPNQPGDSAKFELYIVDEAGHKSNRITTNSILF